MATQIANRSAIAALEPRARNRVNTAYMCAAFAGQLMGTAVGNRVFAAQGGGEGGGGGWRAAGGTSLGFIVLAVIVCLARGPRETGWVGWGGGWPRLGLKMRTKGGKEGGEGDVEREGKRIDGNNSDESVVASPAASPTSPASPASKTEKEDKEKIDTCV